eukprot:CAMPEP_0181210596 /NCGR_PEP_ID=MMETSP1096-20121128/23321_1 /TAXON_ID=156174 ORGANISM="Chrysochromulina ericina, Strain CCMP281" /NCGR_SAMPLE_ID=MMETSP1096 /ASSEMBLY_ACC=CAM_ASM_000453 /LENGTH=65 /DNA_ID=CAMNT_0023301909 /DNA_START=598 /DNA_END=795 /DNA_ORIENTATION=-
MLQQAADSSAEASRDGAHILLQHTRLLGRLGHYFVHDAIVNRLLRIKVEAAVGVGPELLDGNSRR